MRANSYAEITARAEAGIVSAAERLRAKPADVRGFYLAGGEWDAETSEELTEEIVRCWREVELTPDPR